MALADVEEEEEVPEEEVKDEEKALKSQRKEGEEKPKDKESVKKERKVKKDKKEKRKDQSPAGKRKASSTKTFCPPTLQEEESSVSPCELVTDLVLLAGHFLNSRV
mmetsp:Transcript_4160/g.4757  ORF Transcript_4160/g.4757 Transcript_4160/m.4757 type:complete len:106 (-) Transcript_4160:177-494(-)